MTALEPLNIVRPYKLRVEDFLMLDAAGVFEGHGKTELIDGGIVFMNAQYRPHARVKMAVNHALRDALAVTHPHLTVFTEATVAMPPHDAPEPDILVTSEPDGDGPVPLSSIALIVEVADTTVRHDRGVKLRAYAMHGVPEYWVADVQAGQLHQMWAPEGETYRNTRSVPFGEGFSILTLSGVTLAGLPA